MKNKSKLLNFIVNLAKETGKNQLFYFGKKLSTKTKSSNIDFFTEADLTSEKFIISEIEKKYPEHSILTEESGLYDKKSEFRWVIDPLDGTTNFKNNIPIFAVSIALQKNEKTIYAAVYNPAADKCFYAEKKKGAFLDDERIYVSSSNTLSDSLLVTGFPYKHDTYYNLSFEIFKDFYDSSQGVRRLGAAALDLCFVAMGRFSGYYEFNLHPWDICAGLLIAEEAGALCSDWNNNHAPFSGKRILCTNGKVHEEMIEILNKKKYNIFYNLK